MALKDMIAQGRVGARDIKSKDVNKISSEDQKRRIASSMSSSLYWVTPPERGQVYRQTDEGLADDKKEWAKTGVIGADGKTLPFEQVREDFVKARDEARASHRASIKDLTDPDDVEGTKGKSAERVAYFKAGGAVFKFKWSIESETQYEPEDPGERTAYYYDTFRTRVDPNSIELA